MCWRMEWPSIPGFLPGGSLGQRGAWRGYSPWSHKDTTKWLNHHSRRRHWVMKWRGVIEKTNSIPCHHLLILVKWSRSVVSDSLRPRGLQHPRDSPGKTTGVGCHVLLQGIVPTQGPNPGLPLCRRMLYPLSHQGSPFFAELSRTSIL